MSCSSAIYTVYTGSVPVVAGGALPAGTTVRRYGKNINQIGDGIVLDGAGYYKITVDVVLTGSAAGTVTIQLTEDAAPIQGALASVTTAPNSIYTVSIQALVRKKCCDTPTTIQAKLSQTSTATTVNQVTNVITKV